MIEIRREEIFELIAGWIGISIIFSVLYWNTNIGLVNVFILSLITAGLAFIVHELSHKFVAIYYKCTAIFKVDYKMLLAGLFMSFLGFLFIVPGSVVVRGFVTRAQNAIIALAGPVSNIILGLLFIPFMFLSGLFGVIGYFGFLINSVLGLFNMIPYGPFDGAKVIVYSKVMYIVVTLILLLMFIVGLLI